MKRIRTEYADAKGWTRWVQPVMKGYKLACCDCGLVHHIDFRIAGTRKLRVQFRAKRAEAYTRACRKSKGI